MMTEVKSCAAFFSSCLPGYTCIEPPKYPRIVGLFTMEKPLQPVTPASWIRMLLLITYNNGRSLGKTDNGESGLALRPGWRSCNIPQNRGIIHNGETVTTRYLLPGPRCCCLSPTVMAEVWEK